MDESGSTSEGRNLMEALVVMSKVREDRHKELAEALAWIEENNIHGCSMPPEHAQILVTSNILYFNSEHQMFDVIEPIKRWLGGAEGEKKELSE